MTRLETAGMAAGWSIDSSNNIHWNVFDDGGDNIKFSILSDPGSEPEWSVWAEICPHHWDEDQHGTAKAVWE